MGETSDYFMDNGARYWRLICGLFGVIEEIKSPCGCRGFECVGYLSSRLATQELHYIPRQD